MQLLCLLLLARARAPMTDDPATIGSARLPIATANRGPPGAEQVPSRAAWQTAGCPRHNVPRARDPSVAHPSPTCAATDSLAAVRCCGPRRECESVCRRDALETCARTGIDGHLTSFAEAGAECAAHGRRLCTRRELDDGNCCRAGCNMDGVLVWSSDECTSIAANRPPVAAPVSTAALLRQSSESTALLSCAKAAGFRSTPRGFGPCCDRGSIHATPNDALLNFSFLKRYPSAQLRLPAKQLRVQTGLCADGRACSFNPTIEQAIALLGPAPQRGTFVDVGANGGWETRNALTAGMNVLAVECLPEAYRELQGLFRDVPTARLRLLHACASNSTGVVTLHRAADSSSMVSTNVQGGPEALKAGKERIKESQVRSVVLDTELLPTERPDPAPIRVDNVRLVKIDTQVAPRRAPSTTTSTANSHRLRPPRTVRVSSFVLPPIIPPPIPLLQGNELRVLSGLRRTLRTWRPLVFFENNQMDPTSLAAVEAMLTTAPLSYICTRGLQDTLCVHERRQHRNAGTKHARAANAD